MPLTRSGWSRHDLGMVVVSLIWGANFTANKYALGTIPPIAFGAARFLLASGLLWLIVRWRGRPETVPRATYRRLLLLGLVGNTGYQVLFMVGLMSTTAVNASLIMASMPIMVVVLGALSGIERASGRLWVGIGVATIGVGIVIAARGLTFSTESLRGDGMILAATVAWAVFTLGIRRYAVGLDPVHVTAITTYGGTPGLVLLGWGELRRTAWLTLPAGAIGSLLYSTVLSSVVAYVLWSTAVQGIGGNRTAIYNSLVPVVAVAVAWVILGEQLLPIQSAGAILVLAGVYLSQGTGRPAPMDPALMAE